MIKKLLVIAAAILFLPLSAYAVTVGWTYNSATNNVTPYPNSNTTASTSLFSAATFWDSGLTSGNCVQAGVGGILTTTGAACSTGGSSASSTLLTDNNTFSGIDNFTNSSSNFAGTLGGSSLATILANAFSTTSANYWKTQTTFTGASSTLLGDNNTFTGGNFFNASTTIGNSTQAGGLTISGGATTTLNSYTRGFINTSGTTGGYSIDGNLILQASSTDKGTFVGQGAGSNIISTNIGTVALGYNALNLATSSFQNTAVGYEALQNSQAFGASPTVDGGDNTAVGYTALFTNTAGFSNTAIGNAALFANTTGASNVAIGNSVLNSNTTGGANTAVGISALTANTSNSNETAVGADALRFGTGASNTALGTSALNGVSGQSSGGDNSAVGNSALSGFTTGGLNDAFGFDSDKSDTTGGSNDSMGFESLFANLTGGNNVSIGGSSLFDATSSNNNTMVGFTAGNSISGATGAVGGNNTGFGYKAGFDITTGSHNISLGDFTTTGVGITTGSNNILLGQDVRPVSQTASNQLNIGNLLYATSLGFGTTVSTGNVGIGTSTPGSLLSLNNVANFTTATSTFYSTGGLNLAAGCYSINGVCIGQTAASSTLLTDNNTFSGNNAFSQITKFSNGFLSQASSTVTGNLTLATTTGIFLDEGGMVYNVKAYGAKGDGVTSDTQAIRNAINAQQTNCNGYVYFPGGTYLVPAINNSQASFVPAPGNGSRNATCTLYLQGAGMYSTILQATSSNPILAVNYNGAGFPNVAQVIAQDMTFDGNYSGVNGGLVPQPSSGASEIISLGIPFEPGNNNATSTGIYNIFQRDRFYRAPGFTFQPTSNDNIQDSVFDSDGQPDVASGGLHWDILGSGGTVAIVQNNVYENSSGNYADFVSSNPAFPPHLIFTGNQSINHQIGGLYALGSTTIVANNVLQNNFSGSYIGYDASTISADRSDNQVYGNTLKNILVNNGSASFSSYGDLVYGNIGPDSPAYSIFAPLQVFQASSTLFSNFGTAYFGGSATSTFNSAGVLTLASPLAISSGGTATSTIGVTNGIIYNNGTNWTNGGLFTWNGSQNGIIGPDATNPLLISSTCNCQNAQTGIEFRFANGVSTAHLAAIDAQLVTSNVPTLEFMLSANANNAPSEYMRLNPTGLGIGTTNPQFTLEVQGTASTTKLFATQASTTQLTASSNVWFTGITAGSLLATDANQKLIATSTISNSLLQASGVSGSSCTNCNLSYNSQGIITVAANGSAGGGGAWPFTPSTYAGVANQSTTTPFWLNGTQLIASSTLTVNATTTGYTVLSTGTGPTNANDALFVDGGAGASTNGAVEIRQNGGNQNGLFVHSGDNVQGSTLVQFTNINTSDTGPTLAIQNKGTGNLLNLGNNATNPIDVITNAGNLGISSTTPGTLLSLGTGSSFINLNNAATSTFAFGANFLSGSIGVGTSTPTATLTSQLASSTLSTASAFDVWGLMNTVEWLFERIDEWGHVITSGPAPSVTGGTSSVSGNDRNGKITVTGTALTSVTLTFAHAYAAAPDCTESDNSTALTADITSISTTQIVFGFSVGVSSATVWYQCQQHI
jgi:hypothetical protein